MQTEGFDVTEHPLHWIHFMLYAYSNVNDGYGNYSKPQPIKMTFTATPEKWTITDEKGVTHHWCWLDDMWDKFANTDVVAWIWGENASKKMMKSTETRANAAPGE